jgi:hypothetical protein
MLCDEVIRELAVPTDDRDSAGLAEHLASCPSCAEWSKRDAQLDRLWEATRPKEPSSEEWDSVWAHLASSLDSSRPTVFEAFALPIASSNGSVAKVETPLVAIPRSSRSRRTSLAAIGVLGLAQAAAIFIVVALSWRQPSTTSHLPQIADNPTSAASSSVLPKVAQLSPTLSATGVEIEEGRLVVIRVDGPAAKVIDLTPEGTSYSVDDWYLMFNEVEAIDNPVVARKE